MQFQEGKDILIACLSSLDVRGLGIPSLNGNTLVMYSGSLTDLDFHAIAQVASFVLYDLVPEFSFTPWVTLGRLVPLIWQLEILDRDSFLVCVHFLALI